MDSFVRYSLQKIHSRRIFRQEKVIVSFLQTIFVSTDARLHHIDSTCRILHQMNNHGFLLLITESSKLYFLLRLYN